MKTTSHDSSPSPPPSPIDAVEDARADAIARRERLDIHHVGVDVENDDGARATSDGRVVFFFSLRSIRVVNVDALGDALGGGMDEEPRT